MKDIGFPNGIVGVVRYWMDYFAVSRLLAVDRYNSSRVGCVTAMVGVERYWSISAVPMFLCGYTEYMLSNGRRTEVLPA